MPSKSKQQQKFFGVVKAMQKGDIPKKGEAGEVADDMTKKEVDKMASTKHKGLVNKIKELVEEEIKSLEGLEEIGMFHDPLGYQPDDEDPTEKDLSIINKARAAAALKQIKSGKRDDGMGKFTGRLFGVTPSGKVQQITDPKDLNMYKKFGLAESVLKEAKSANALRADYDKAVKKEQALSSLLLVNLEKFKAAKAKGDEKAVAKHTKIAGDLSKKKKVATEKASQAYKAYQDKITGLHSDAELELKEGANANRWFSNLKYYYQKGLSSPDLRDPAEKKAYNKLAKQFFSKLREGKLNEGRGVMDLIKNAVEELMFDSNISEKEAAMELVTAISDEYQFDAKLKEGMLNEMDMNDPILVAIRARKTMLDKAKSAPKPKKISMNKYYKLMDMESDLIDQMKDAAKELAQLNSDMNAEAGQKGDNWSDADANRYGGDLDKLQSKYEKLAKQKAKIKKAIMTYRIS